MIDERIQPISNIGRMADGIVSWVFNAKGGITAIVRYDINEDTASITLRDDSSPDSAETYSGDSADDMIKSCLGYHRRWIFKEDDGKWLFIHPRTEMWLETKYFVTCLRMNSERSPSWLRQHVQHLIEKNGLEVSDELKKWDGIHDEGTDSRCMGWYEHLEDAVDVLEHNRMDVHECSYTYAVIEKVRSGPYAKASEVQWYIWDGDKGEHGGYVECDKPSQLERIVHFCF